MKYAKWETFENVVSEQSLQKFDGTNKIKSVGIPVAYDDKNLYVDGRGCHSLIIGTTGSGKTQSITLPMLKLACINEESVIVHDVKSELYDETNEMFKSNGYNVIKLNFDNSIDTNSWNPFELPNKLYKEGDIDSATDMIEELGHYLLTDADEVVGDPFWINSAVNYFTGITLYAIENYDEVNFNTLLEVESIINNDSNFINNVDKKSGIYFNLRNVLEAPNETKGSILSVFSQKIKKYISKVNLMKMLEKSDFDILSIAKEKTIIYLISGNSNNSEHLLPLLLTQIYYTKSIYSKNEGKINIIIDDFYMLNPIKNFSKILNNSRGIYIKFTIIVRGFNDLTNMYGKENTEIIKLCFGNIVYLLSQDLSTLKDISELCGNTLVDDKVEPLITVEELKTLKYFEAIVITPRLMPFKTKLLPYYILIEHIK